MNHLLLISGIVLIGFGLILFQGSAEQLDDLKFREQKSLSVDTFLELKHGIERSMIVSTGGVVVGIILALAGVFLKKERAGVEG